MQPPKPPDEPPDPPLPPEVPRSLFGRFAKAVRGDWRTRARPSQIPPPDFSIFLELGGRGSGKTWSAANYVNEQAASGAVKRVALIGGTADAVRFTMVEGESGILAVARAGERPTYEPAKGQLTWPSGCIARMFSADQSETLRGPEHDLAWADELAAWRRADETWSNLLLTMRIGKQPRIVVSTTPKPTRLIRELVSRDGQDGIVVSHTTTYDNRANLSPSFFAQLVRKFEGTRAARQELLAELLLDTPGALWNRDVLEASRVDAAPAQLQRIVIAIDPAGSTNEGSDETGIVCCAIGEDQHGYVLSDLSGRYAPTEWARKACAAFHSLRADKIVVERNYGGAMAAATIASVDAGIPVKEITSSRGKVLRGEPISSLFEQRRAHIVGMLAELEDQLCSFTADWNRARDGSPDRCDAMVFALTELMCSHPVGGFFRESSLLVAGAPVEMPRLVEEVFAVAIASEADTIIAVIFCAATSHAELGHPLTVLDWILAEAEEALTPEWLAQVLERGQELARECGRRGEHRAPLFVEETPFGQVMREFAAVYGLDVQLLDPKIMGPPDLLVRATAARGYVSTGAVKISRAAHEKITTHRGVSRNHLMGQILAFDPENNAKQEAVEFVAAFCAAIIAELPGRRVSALPQLEMVTTESTDDDAELAAATAAASARLAEQHAWQADIAAWNIERDGAVAAIRARLGDPHWQPRSMLALGIRPRPQAPGLVVA
jgi:phage terminase large subunit-like protein